MRLFGLDRVELRVVVRGTRVILKVAHIWLPVFLSPYSKQPLDIPLIIFELSRLKVVLDSESHSETIFIEIQSFLRCILVPLRQLWIETALDLDKLEYCKEKYDCHYDDGEDATS